MKKKMYLFSYVSVLLVAISLQSCNEEPITPNDCSGIVTDTTWVEDSTTNNGGGDNPNDTIDWNGGGDNPYDSTGWNGGGDNPGDSTGWNPYDSTNIGG